MDNPTKNKDVAAQYLQEAGTASQALYLNVEPLANTRFGRPVAFMLNYVVTSAASAAFAEGHYAANDVVATFGPLVWLPPMTEAQQRPSI